MRARPVTSTPSVDPGRLVRWRGRGPRPASRCARAGRSRSGSSPASTQSRRRRCVAGRRSWARQKTASERSAATTPWASASRSGWSSRTTSPPWRSGRSCLWRSIHARELVEVAVVGVEQVPLDAEVAEQRRGGPEREALDRPVVWARGGPMWAPMTSGGNRWEKPRWMSGVRAASLQSEVQIRAVRRRIPASARPPPEAHDSNSTPGWAAPSASSSRYRATGLAVRAGAGDVTVHVPLHERDVVVGEQTVEMVVQVRPAGVGRRGRARAGSAR